MRLSPAATVGVLLGLALILPGCGEGAASTAIAEKAPGPSREPAAKGGTPRVRCPGRLRDFLTAMDGLRDRLVVGLSYDAYLDAVREVRAVYDDVPAARLSIACLTVSGAPGERALNRYLDAANTWGDCLAAVGCEIESLESKLRRKWRLASDLLSTAQRGLRGSAPS